MGKAQELLILLLPSLLHITTLAAYLQKEPKRSRDPQPNKSLISDTIPCSMIANNYPAMVDASRDMALPPLWLVVNPIV